jgi:Stage II sporulation protein E (SpoIIE)
LGGLLWIKQGSIEGSIFRSSGVSYRLADTFVQLSPDARLTLMTDGVVEARKRGGELFGFERARMISTQSPESIANEAQAIGQEDDITVVSVQRTPPAGKQPVEILTSIPSAAV